MTMNDTDQLLNDDEADETIVAPRFDDEETVLARPVVPLGEVGDAPAEMPAARPSTATPPHSSGLRAKPRRSLVAALVLVSALVGSVLGVGGLYLYQKQRNAAAEEPAAEQQAETPAPVTQPTSEAETQTRDANSKAAETTASAPAAPETSAQDKEDNDAGSAKDKASEKADDKSASERRGNSEDREAVATTKRGKKGSRDEEPQREERRARRDDEQSARDDDDDNVPDRREARRVGVITYRPRRAIPRRGPYADADRLRRIFEGQP